MVEIAVTDKAVAIVLPDFVEKVIETEDKHLWSHALKLMKKLEPLQPLYLTEHNLTLITPIVRFPEQDYIIGELFTNLPPAEQTKMMHIILNKEEKHLHVIIRAIIEQIDTVL